MNRPLTNAGEIVASLYGQRLIAERDMQYWIDKVVQGEATLGDPIDDFVVRKLKAYSPEILARYHMLQDLLGAHRGELILICRCWTEEVTTLHGGPIDGNESYTHIHTDLILGIVNGKLLKVDEEGCKLNLRRYVARMPTRVGSGGLHSRLEWELFRGLLNLELGMHGKRAEGWLYPGFDWSLPLDEKIDTTRFRGNSMFPQLGVFPEPPVKLSIAVGNEAVDDWLIEHNALLRGTGLHFDQAFELLRREAPPRAAAKLESMREYGLATQEQAR